MSKTTELKQTLYKKHEQAILENSETNIRECGVKNKPTALSGRLIFLLCLLVVEGKIVTNDMCFLEVRNGV